MPLAWVACWFLLAAAGAAEPRTSKLYLVGIGPGDPELVTFKAAAVLKQADCVFCFEYVKDQVARYARSDAIHVASPLLMQRFVGQKAKSLPPELADKAAQSRVEMARFVPQVRQLVAAGKTVAFADAGDVTVFCPWAWVLETFADLEPTVVPGLSSFNAANGALKRCITSGTAGVLLSAGDYLGSPDEDGRLRATLVFFTHRNKAEDLIPRLKERYPADTPLAIVCEASFPTEEVIYGTLATLPEQLRHKRLPDLYLIYVGEGLRRPAPAANRTLIGAPQGLNAEQSLTSRYPYVVEDALRLCQPKKGLWIDLGAGKGQVAIPLIEKTGNPVLMVDPNAESLSKGLAAAREKGFEDRLFAVVGKAENLPLPDGSADFLVSRGSIFFWEDPVQGLKEGHRVLRPGAKAYIGGGAGSGYPKPDVEKLIQGRKDRLQGDEAERWKRFVELRRPEQMRQWAEAAGLRKFEVFGQGAISADDPRVGQGVWLLYEKPAGQ